MFEGHVQAYKRKAISLDALLTALVAVFQPVADASVALGLLRQLAPFLTRQDGASYGAALDKAWGRLGRDVDGDRGVGEGAATKAGATDGETGCAKSHAEASSSEPPRPPRRLPASLRQDAGATAAPTLPRKKPRLHQSCAGQHDITTLLPDTLRTGTD